MFWFNLTFDLDRVINEPTAAALAYGFEHHPKGIKHILIYDFGGGTFDTSILRVEDGVYDVLATKGDTQLGGADIDNRIADFFAQDFNQKHRKDLTCNSKSMSRLKSASEKAKIALAHNKIASVEIDCLFEGIDYSGKISRAKFDDMNDDLFKKTLNQVEEALKDAKLTKGQIDDVVLVGGSTRILKIQTLLSEFFDGKDLRKGINQDEAVALGAAIQAALLNGQQVGEVEKMSILDVTPLSLGIEVYGDKMAVLIGRNTRIPCEVTTTLGASVDDQTSISIDIYQGEKPLAKDNKLLRYNALHNLPPTPRGENITNVTFQIDEDGILHAKVVAFRNPALKLDMRIESSRLSASEIERMIQDAQKLRERDLKLVAIVDAKNSLEDYCYTVKKQMKDDDFSLNQVIKSSIIWTIVEAKKWLQDNDYLELSDVKEVQTHLETVCGPHFKELDKKKFNPCKN